MTSATFVSVALALNCYAQFTEETIVIKRAVEPRARRYSYDDVEAIGIFSRFRMRGELYPYYAIRFRDGATWTTWEGCRDPDFIGDQAIMAFVSLASKKDIQEIDSVDELKSKDRR